MKKIVQIPGVPKSRVALIAVLPVHLWIVVRIAANLPGALGVK
jgi:hypothetical protein